MADPGDTPVLPAWQARHIVGAMKTRSVKLPGIVRVALEQRGSGNVKGQQKRPTMADAIAELRGTISGPRDLSTNPKYLDDLGK